MPDAPAATVLGRKAARNRAHDRLRLASPTPAAATTLLLDGVEAVEIVTPDRHSAMLLLDYAAPTFPAELVQGRAWIVRFRPPPSAEAWVTDLLALVERWLASAPIPCAGMRRGGHSHLIRGPLDAA
jgi:hypothetical protein